MAKYGRYYESKKEETSAHQMALLLFVSPFVIGISFGIIHRIFTGSYPGETGGAATSVITCAQARSQWELAMEARDAVTPAEAVTSSGRAKWEQLRDRANELEQVKNDHCN
ncbi:MAG: hypothetical protein ACRCZS_06750 [Chroococcidiopsis sp.]